MKLYDRFAEEFIDEKERDMCAPPERYEEMGERDYHLKDVMVFKNGQCVGHGLLDESRQLLFSGYITCEMAKASGFVWKCGEEGEANEM
ncbi:MAG: hypothetical protein IIY21_09015 [Clostridiales bacterium]|nr:hypothetical protein [Clostridiales bacterium]